MRLFSLACLSLVSLSSVFAFTTDSNWSSHNGGDLKNQRCKIDPSGITLQNVCSLTPKWRFQVQGDVASTPTIVDNRVYVSDWNGHLTCYDLATSQVQWVADINDGCNLGPEACAFTRVGSRVSPIVHDGIVVIGGYTRNVFTGGLYAAKLFAYDASTGQKLWSIQADDHPHAVITSSPSIDNDGNLFFGIASVEEAAGGWIPGYQCCSFRGSIMSVNIHTGAVNWKTYMIPEELNGVGMYSGVGVWGASPAIQGDSVYVATGNTYNVPQSVTDCQAQVDAGTLPPTTQCVDPAVLQDSIVALDRLTGDIKFVKRAYEYDAWNWGCLTNPANCPAVPGPDVDFGQAPMLFGNQAIAGQKTGVLWSVKKTDGSEQYGVLTGPGSSGGGHMWGSSLSEIARIAVVTNVNFHAKPWNLPNGETIYNSFWSGVNPSTGEILWSTKGPTDPNMPFPGFVYSPTTISNDVVLSTAMDGKMYGLNLYNGQIVFSSDSTGATSVTGVSVAGRIACMGNGYDYAMPGGWVTCFEASSDPNVTC